MSSSGQKSSATNALPRFVEPAAQRFLGAYENQVYDENGNLRAYPNINQQVAGFDPRTTGAFDTMGGLTPYAQNLVNLDAAQTAGTAQGQYLMPESNPYIRATFNAAADPIAEQFRNSVTPGIMAAAQRSGQMNSSAMDELYGQSEREFGRTLSDLGTKIYGGNYAAERANQLAAQGRLPQVAQNLYAPSLTEAGVGAQYQAQRQAEMDTAYGNEAARAEWPYQLLSGMGSALGQAAGGMGSSVTKTRGGGGFMGSVICTECYRQGLMDERTYMADSMYGAALSEQIVRGYQRFGIPIAKAMRRSRLVTLLITPVALSWGRTMAARVHGQPEKETLLGRFLLKYGVPLCAWLGRDHG